MVCSTPTETRLVEQISEHNVGFRLKGTEEAARETIESMIDHMGRTSKSTLCLCEGVAPQQSILANDAEWVDVEFEVVSTVDQPTTYVTLAMCPVMSLKFLVEAEQAKDSLWEMVLESQVTATRSLICKRPATTPWQLHFG